MHHKQRSMHTTTKTANLPHLKPVVLGVFFFSIHQPLAFSIPIDQSLTHLGNSLELDTSNASTAPVPFSSLCELLDQAIPRHLPAWSQTEAKSPVINTSAQAEVF